MKTTIETALTLLKTKQYSRFAFKMMERIPRRLFRFNSFYFVRCETLQNIEFVRPLGEKYCLNVEDFRYELFDRIKCELLHDTDGVIYRTRGRENATYVIYIEYGGTIVATSFLMYHDELISPSGYVLKMNESAPMVYGAFIDPAHRLKGLHLHMVKAAYNLVASREPPRLYGEIQYMNMNSLTSYKRLGFDIFMNIKYIQLFGKKIFF